MIDMMLMQCEIQRLDTALREERGRAKQMIGAMEILLDEVRGHAVELDRTRRALTTLTETLVGELIASRDGHAIEQRVLSGNA